MAIKHVLLTGPPGVGKSTAIKKICEILKDKNLKFDGFFTEEVRAGRERIGFDIVTLSGERSNLARVRNSSLPGGPQVGKYTVDVSSFEKLALPVFDCDVDILVLDEIGKMELFSKQFLAKVKTAFSASNKRILATIPVAKNNLPFVNELRSREDCLLIEITRQNRNSIVEEIVEKFITL